jgi:K+-sensing histidine kinase KdpD
MKRIKTLLNQNIWLLSILLGIACWLFDGLIDFLFFSQASLVESILFPESVEVWMRSFNFCLIVFFWWIIQLVWNRKNKIQEELELNQDQGKQLLHHYRSILAGTSQHTGENFFTSMVQQLAGTLNVRYAFIGNLSEKGTRIQSLAFFSDGKLLKKIEYDLSGTPCENVLNSLESIYSRNVQARFPKDDYLLKNNIESYLGYSLRDMDNSPIGIMSVMDTKAFDASETENIKSILKAFATRVEAEMRRIEIERKLELYANKLEQSNQDLEDFAYIASHDLKEPLRKIIIFGEMFEKKVARLDAEQKDILRRMIKGASRMNDLIDDLLQLSRIKTQSANLVEWDLNEIVKATLEELEFSILDTQAKIHVAELPTLKVDKVYIHQLFLNLIGNSLKYKNPDHPPEITVHAQKNKQNLWVISVADNGIGFDEKYAQRIFKPFERLHGKDAYNGTGMGLAICRKIVDRHNGTLTANSSPGNGSTFTLVIPEE